MRLHILAAATAMALVLAGCASSSGLHPDGVLSDASTLMADQSLARLNVSPAGWPSQDWWTGLGDPQLNALIDEALKNNPDLTVADARAREAQAQVQSAHADQLPSVKASGSAGGARLPTTAAPLGDGHYAPYKYADASFSWDLDLWGGKRAAWEAALGQARASDIDRRAARIEVSTNVARAYVQLAYAYAQVDVAKDELTRASAARTLTVQRVAAGIDTQMQVKQSDSEVASAQQQLALAQRSIDAAQSSLAILLGQGPDRGLAIGRPATLIPAAVAVPSDLPVDLIGHRADLVAARWRVEAAGQTIKNAKTQFLPNVSLAAYAGLVVLGSDNLFQAPTRFFSAAPSISLPIFDGGRLRANLTSKDAQYDEAVAQYNKTLIGAVNQVADDLSALHWMGEQLAAEQRAVDAATQAWQLAQQRYQAGVGNFLDALTVRQQLLTANQRMASLRAQQVDISVQLIQALGGGFRPQGDEASVATSSQPSRF